MHEPHGYITSFDGTRLFYRFWEPPSPPRHNKVILILHGIAYHSDPYLKEFKGFFSSLRISLYAMDDRGHGLSGRERGNLESPYAIMRDLDAMLDFLVQTHPDKKLFLAGESMGGLFATAYSASHSNKISGLILIAPGLIIHRDQICHPETFKAFPIALLRPGEATIDVVGSRLEMGSRDPEFIRERREDKLALSKVSLKYLLTIAKINAWWERRYPRKIKVPTLILQGLQDRVLDSKGAVKLHDLIESEDKTLVTFPEAFHTLLWDPDTPKVFKAISEWLTRY